MRRRLVIAIAGVAAAAMILFAIPLALVLQHSYRNEELLRLQRDTIAATRAIDLGAPGRDPVELPVSDDQLALYDAGGQRTAGHGRARADPLVRTALRTGTPADRAQGGRLITAVPLLVREQVRGALRAQRSDAAAARQTHRAWLTLAVLAALLVVLAILAASLLGRRLARPLERLAAAARRLGDGDFAARAPRGGVPEADQIAAALDDTARRLGDLLTRERAFSADTSHQLRTPLAALRIELEAIDLRGDSPPELRSALAQVDRLQATIDTLLAVARDAPRPVASTDLATLLDDLESRWHGALAADARPLRVLRRTDKCAARAAPAVVAEIVDVLLDNAHRHGTGSVTVTLRVSGQWVAVDVSDQGPGFTDGTEQLFTRRGGSRDGHGIGLALAQALAHAEGGRLTITEPSPPTVTLWLRRADADAEASPDEAESLIAS
jgi:signal transduction histidine kinase